MITHYVYELRNPDTNELYYIGKGNSKRSRHQDHINEAHRLINGNSVKNRIRAGKTRKIIENGNLPLFIKIYESNNEKEVLEEEKKLILKYGRINNNTGCLANLTDGGEGTSGWNHSDEAITKN